MPFLFGAYLFRYWCKHQTLLAIFAVESERFSKHALHTVCLQVLDAIQGLADDINNAISDKLPIVIEFNETLHAMIDDLTINAASTLLRFHSEIGSFSSQLASLHAVLNTLTSDVTDAGELDYCACQQ